MAEKRAIHPIWLKVVFVLYTLVCTIVFVYALFPYDVLKGRIEESLTQALGSDVTLGHIRPSFLWGFTVDGFDVKGVRVAKELTISPRPLYLFTGTLGLGFNAAMASSGGGEGYLRMPFKKSKKPVEISLSLTNMDMSSLATLFPPNVKPKGNISGEFNLVTPRDTLDKATGGLSLNWKKGTLPLNLDALPIDALIFDTLEFDAKINKGVISIEKADLAGEISGNMMGNVRFSKNIKRSRLNITGELILPESMRNALGVGMQPSGQTTRFSLRGSLERPRFRLITPYNSRLNNKPGQDNTANGQTSASLDRRMPEKAAPGQAGVPLERLRPEMGKQDVGSPAQSAAPFQSLGQDEDQPQQPSQPEGE
jgi:type II secretion system protein N